MRRALLPSFLIFSPIMVTPTPVVPTAPPPRIEAPSVPTLRPSVVARYPHDRGAFTQGLQYLGNGRYLESTGQVGESGVRVSDLKTAKVLRQVPTPLATAFGEGSTLLGKTVYHITWQDGVAFSFDLGTLRETGRHRYPGEGWGLTNDGKSLIMSSGSAQLVWRDPKTFAPQRSVTVTAGGREVGNLNELEYVQGSIYANIWLTDQIARIDPQSGKVTAWIDVSALTREATLSATRQRRPLTFDDVPNGIAYVPERGTLLLTGKRWPTLFEVKVSGVGQR